jgi:hypothetical protein
MKTAILAVSLPLLIAPGPAMTRPTTGRRLDLSVADAALTLSAVRASRVLHLGADVRLLTTAQPNPVDDATFAVVNGIKARDFVVEAVVKGSPIDNGSTARGFVGIAFRISDDRTRFEAVYLRPTNARADDQLRRNHTTQYIAHPDYPWERLRRDEPGKYESHVDLDADRWTKIRLSVAGTVARLYVNDATQPALIVDDLKLPPASGAIGLWVGPGSRGYFKSLKITVTRP